MEEKAGPWKVRQMMRMDEEMDDQGNPPQELSNWKDFAEYFLTQYRDPGLIEQAKIKWKGGINQKGRAVNYFEEVEMLLLHLAYERDSEQTLDQVVGGLKPHIQTHFIGKEWKSLNAMKKEVVPYDAAFWEINTRATGEKTQTFASSSKATSSTTHEQGKSQTPQIKAEVSKMGGTQRRFLPEDKFEYCKKNRLCFMCKVDGLEIVGSVKFHPNHLPQNTTKNKDKEIKKTKIAATGTGKEGYRTRIRIRHRLQAVKKLGLPAVAAGPKANVSSLVSIEIGICLTPYTISKQFFIKMWINEAVKVKVMLDSGSAGNFRVSGQFH